MQLPAGVHGLARPVEKGPIVSPDTISGIRQAQTPLEKEKKVDKDGIST